nr:hypothetical protein [Tanacetum cinerariifolium]
MSSITVQKAKLDLELVPKEKRLEIRKCNERLNLGKIQKEPTFQVILDALALTPCYSAFLIIVDVPERVKRPAKKSTETPARGVFIRETPEIPLTKKMEKVDVTRGNDEDDNNNEQVSSDEHSDQEKESDDDNTQTDNEHKSDSEHETDESESGSESNHDKSEENEEDDDDEYETKITDNSKGDKDEEIDYAMM